MSKPNVYILNCPQCGAENQVTVWESVNVTLDPDLKEMVLTGSLFQHKCHACSFTGGIAHPCLYHDMDRKLLIYLMPAAKGGEADLADMDLSPFPAEMMDGYIMRRVATVDRLREKVMILDSGKDDRVVELYKRHLLERISDAGTDFRPAEAYYEAGEEGRFVVIDEKGRSIVLTCSPELYNKIEKEFSPMFDDRWRPSFLTIDDGWAFSIINGRLPPYPRSEHKS